MGSAWQRKSRRLARVGLEQDMPAESAFEWMGLSAQHRGTARFGGDFGLFTPIFQYLGNLFDSAIASIEGQFAAS
jgi:hypothetical protein